MAFIFWPLLICAIGALAIPFVILCIVGFWKRQRWLVWLGGIPAGAFLCLALTLAVFLGYGWTHPSSESTDPKEIRRYFVQNFAFEPGEDFVPLHQEIYGFGDTTSLRLKFKLSRETFAKLHESGFEPISFSSFQSETGGANAPSWWVGSTNNAAECFVNHEWKGNFASNTAYLYRDPVSGEVFFYHLGID